MATRDIAPGRCITIPPTAHSSQTATVQLLIL